MTNHPNRSAMVRTLDKLSAEVERMKGALRESLEVIGSLQKELQLAASWTGTYYESYHADRILEQYGIKILAGQSLLDLESQLMKVELEIELTHDQQMDLLREAEDQHDDEMRAAYGRTFP